MSSTSVLLPEPLTPVMQVNAPSGMRTSMFRRLFSVAPTISSQPRSSEGAMRFLGTGFPVRRVRYWPVSDFVDIAEFRPACPPPPVRRRARPRPGRGPECNRRARMVSSSCSTTSTVLPRSRRPLQRGEQAVIVALVQADARLIQHVEHAHQRRRRSAWPAGCVAPRRRKACRFRGPA